MTYQLVEKPNLTDRVKRLKDSFFDAPVKLSTERLKSILKVYKEAGPMQMPVVTRAKVFEDFLKTATLHVDENPIVGTLCQYRRGCNPYPEWSCSWWLKKPHSSQFGGVEPYLAAEDRELIREAYEYFDGHIVLDLVNETFSQIHPGLLRREIMKTGVLMDSASGPLGYILADYEKGINVGLEAIAAEANKKLSEIVPVYLEEQKKSHFWKSVIITCEAVIAWANRYAALLEEMSEKEAAPQRKQELLQIAEICRRVPAKPARNFREAIQSFWFMHTAICIEAFQVAISPGRFALYMYPFYRKDIESGAITDEEVIELLELLFIKLSENSMHLTEAGGLLAMPNHIGQNLSIGGVTKDGKDATNELDYLVLEALSRVRMIQPSIVVIWHNKLPERFIKKSLEVARLGLGMPSFVNNDLIVLRNLERYKCSIEEARDFALVACTQAMPAGKNTGSWETFIGMPKMIEFVMNNGTDPLSGNAVGLETGDPEQFQTYEQFHEAVKAQTEYFTKLGRDIDMASISLQSQFLPCPFVSSLVSDCVERGKNLIEGGARYDGDTTNPVGMIDFANSMAAVRKLVFDDKVISMRQLKDALEADFVGFEDIQHMLINAPKYGNDDDYVDMMVRDWHNIFYDATNVYTNHLDSDQGRPMAVVVSLHRMFGKSIGALPNGRKKLTTLTDGAVSATPGTDTQGPTALLKSAAKAIDATKYDGTIFNVKFHTSTWENPASLKKIETLIKSFMELDGYHIQFNVFDAETLKDAQQHPDQYRDLVVRVAGYSAFFVQLDPQIQQEIMSRTEQAI